MNAAAILKIPNATTQLNSKNHMTTHHPTHAAYSTFQWVKKLERKIGIDGDGTRTHILRSEVWCFSFKLHRLMICSPVKGWNRALLHEYLTVLLQQNGRSSRCVKHFTGETCTERCCVFKRHFFSANVWMRNVGLPQRTILHPLSVPKVRNKSSGYIVNYSLQIHIRERVGKRF